MSGRLFQNDKMPTTPIKSDIAPIIQQKIIDEILIKYPNIEYLKLGSVGKKDGYNGDIDIGIKAKDINELSDIIHDVFDYTDTVDNKTIYIISIKYPYDDKFVAVDFILIDNIEYTKFRYYCPDYRKNESHYKVGTKIMFIGTILNHCISDEYKEIINTHIKYEFLPTGLNINLYEYTTGINANYLVTQNPQEVVDIMFNNATPDICNTVESIWEAIHSDKFKYPEELRILELSLFVNSYRKGWEEQVNPDDFTFKYWTSDEIKEKCVIHKKIRDFNQYIFNNYENLI